jgi:uncharacterized repeat protein (TIGR03806 family)
MLVGDQGQSTTEEINTVYPGADYGWNSLEGTECYKPMKGCSFAGVYPPTEFYPRGDGSAIVGGLIYRGQKITSLYGAYVFGDTNSGMVWALPAKEDQQKGYMRSTLGSTDRKVVSFGTDADGELYILDGKEGAICRVDAADGTPPTPEWPLLLSQVGYFSDLKARKLAATVLSYAVNSPLWSDGATKERGLFLPAGSKITYNDDLTSWAPPVGAVAIKTFLVGGTPIETRLLRNSASGWHGATYRWNQGGTEANLMTTEATVPINGQQWPIPSRADCLRCHTQAAGRILGLTTGQMNLDHDMLGNGLVAPQILTLKQQNAFSNPPAQDPTMLPSLPTPQDTSLAKRARAYLHVNCAHCHQPGGLPDPTFDIRYNTPLMTSGLCGVTPQKGDGGVAGATLLTLKSPETSMLWMRMGSLVSTLRMPQLGSNVVDQPDTDLIYNWIKSLNTCN